MNKQKIYDWLPAFAVGFIDAIIIVLALFCFLLATSTHLNLIFLYTSCTVVFVALLLGISGYFTRKEQEHTNEKNIKILKIYSALDIDHNLKEAMTADTLQENNAWQQEWQENENATTYLSPKTYGLCLALGVLCGGTIILINNYLLHLPDYAAFLLPFMLLGFFGYVKFKQSDKNPITGMLLLSISGIAASVGAYFVGSLF